MFLSFDCNLIDAHREESSKPRADLLRTPLGQIPKNLQGLGTTQNYVCI